MTRRPLFVLVGLVALLAIGFAGLWFVTQKPAAAPIDPGEALVQSAPVMASQAPASVIEASAEESSPERQVVQKAPVEKQSTPAATTPLDAELAKGRWVTGKVKFPDGTPPDEKLTVEARGKKFASGTLHKAEVQRDGSFRVAFGPGTRTGWVRLYGRYLYLEEDVRVRFPAKGDAGVEPLDLVPILGGLVRGHLTLPIGVTSASTGLAGTHVQAWRNYLSFAGRSDAVVRNLDGEIGADERFELGGVPAKTSWTLSVDPEAFTRAQKDDVKVDPGKAVDVEIELHLGARLSGTVVDGQGAPVEKAAFTYMSQDGPGGQNWSNFRGKESAADGSFDLRGTPTGKGTLTIQKEGYLPQTTEFAALAEGSAQQGLRIVLASGESLSGIVRWPGGEPAAGALLRVRFTPEDSQTTRSFNMFGMNERAAKCDAQGKFSLAGFPRGKATLQAEAKPTKEMLAAESKPAEASAKQAEEGEPAADSEKAEENSKEKSSASKASARRKWTAILEDQPTGTQNIVLTLDSGFSVTGRVLDSSGAPIEQFLVRAEPVEAERQPWEPARGVVTGRFQDAGGQFTLEGLHEGKWKLRAEAKDAPACTPKQINVPEESGPVVLTLAAACTVSGTVFLPNGQPAHPAHAQADPDTTEVRGLVFNDKKDFNASTSTDGAFEIKGLPPGPLKLHATSEEWADAEELPLELAPGQKLEGVRLTLRVPGRITGLVLDALGHSDAERPISLNGNNSGWDQTKSDAEGRFSFEKVTPGDYMISTQPRPEEYQSSSADPARQNRVWQEQQRSLQVKVAAGATAEVTLGGMPKDAIHLVGHVTCGGHALADAYLQVWTFSKRGEGEQRNFHANTSADGSFDLVLGGAGDYSVNVSGPSNSSSNQFQVKVSSDPRQTRDFELPGARIAGRVVDRKGKALAQVWLQMRADENVRGERPRVSGNVSTDTEGRFVFENIAPGTYKIEFGGANRGWGQAGQIGHTSASGLVVEEGKSIEGLEIVAQPPCRVEGRVLGVDGQPLAGAVVIAVDEKGQSLTSWQRQTTDATGNFEFDALPPGRAAFLAQKGTQTSGYSGWVSVLEDSTAKVDLGLMNGALLFIETVDSAGAKLDCDLQLFDARNIDVTNVGWFAQLGEVEARPGRRFGPLAPGKYSLVVMRKDKADLHQEVSVGADPLQTLRVRCD
ncbi:MAG: carboxypeptidase regulatory-like domain-containing protein [Planctomycetes bacterium]|nr:carboxypeptidase regulatory-like domain-containing protein [Planctomycetota bacterium]